MIWKSLLRPNVIGCNYVYYDNSFNWDKDHWDKVHRHKCCDHFSTAAITIILPTKYEIAATRHNYIIYYSNRGKKESFLVDLLSESHVRRSTCPNWFLSCLNVSVNEDIICLSLSYLSSHLLSLMTGCSHLSLCPYHVSPRSLNQSQSSKSDLDQSETRAKMIDMETVIKDRRLIIKAILNHFFSQLVLFNRPKIIWM